jgi:tRNA (cmo5U34)-methyltransferase
MRTDTARTYAAPVGDQFHFHPDSYLELVRREVPAYDRLQDEVAQAVRGLQPRSILDLGAGTGITSQRVLAAYPDARLIGIDESDEMLEHARRLVPAGDFRVARLEAPLPDGSFDLVISALAVHHLDGPGKADLFRRVAAGLTRGGRVVVGDVVVPEDPADVVAPIDGEYDKPSSTRDQVAWLEEAGFRAYVTWTEADLAVMVGDLTRNRRVSRRDVVSQP